MDIEPAAAKLPQERLGKDRAGGIAGADEQHAELVVGHGVAPVFGWRSSVGTGRAAPAAIVEQVADRPAHGVHVRRIEQRGAGPFLRHEPHLHQVGQVVGQRAALQVERPRDVTGRQPVGKPPHQKTQDCQTLRMAEGRQTSRVSSFSIFHEYRKYADDQMKDLVTVRKRVRSRRCRPERTRAASCGSRHRHRHGPGVARPGAGPRGRTLDDLVQLAPVQPDAATFGAIIDLDALPIGHNKGRSIHGAFHHTISIHKNKS
jgi:hypothetical protein